MTRADDIKLLRRAIEVSRSSREHGNTPFGAVLLEQENIEISTKKCTGHAETALAEKAGILYPKSFLKDFTLYTSAEPCAMCAGAIYWSGIGHVVYAMTEKRLLELTGNNEINPTFSLPCREVFSHGQKDIEAAEVHKGYWS